ncbi:MAG: methyltransferase [Planctomycetota bacterium]|jgi:predicted O-methyltransferase YrrM
MSKQWSAEEVLQVGWSFQRACVLTAAADLDVFSALDGGPMTADALARELETDVRATTILLDALAALEFVTKRGDQYSIADDLADLLSEKSEKNVLPMLRHLANCLARWSRLAGVTKSGKPAERIASIRGEAADQEAFIGAMHNISAPMAAEVVDRLKPLKFTHLLDIGGASGTWTMALLDAAPEARATLFDLPDVVPMAQRRLSDAGLIDKVTLVAGDFYADNLPTGVDLAWLGAICHQNSRPQNRELFAKVHSALAGDGVLVIRDVVMDPSHINPERGALFAVNMLVATEAGSTYTFDEYSEDLRETGFVEVALVHRDEFMNSLIRAKKARK